MSTNLRLTRGDINPMKDVAQYNNDNNHSRPSLHGQLLTEKAEGQSYVVYHLQADLLRLLFPVSQIGNILEFVSGSDRKLK